MIGHQLGNTALNELFQLEVSSLATAKGLR